MRILITGGAGFIGSHLTRHLAQTHDVVVLDRLDHASSLDRLAGVQCQFVRHDLGAPINHTTRRLIGDVDQVYHLAAASHVDRSVTDPTRFVQDNVIGTLHILEFCRQREVPRLLHMSTDEVFGEAAEKPHTEWDRHYPTNPYAGTKAAAEALVISWAATYGIPVLITRSTNVYGPGQDPEKFIPLATRRILAGETIQIHADPTRTVSSTRCYTYVSDVVAALEMIMQRGNILGGGDSGMYNISAGTEHSNLSVAERIASILGKPFKHELVSFSPSRPRHDMAYAVATTKLCALGWAPRIDIQSGLAQTLQEDFHPDDPELTHK